MRYFVLALHTVMAVAAVFMLASMGMDWINPDIGRGLHPAIAFPLATLIACTIPVMILLLISTKPDETPEADRDSDLMVRHY
jgi:hypothetical protein